MKSSSCDIIFDLAVRYPALKCIEKDVLLAAEIITDAYKNGNKLMLCGNGGSASDSLHIWASL